MPTIRVELSAAWGAILGAALAVLAIDLYLIHRWRRRIAARRVADEERAAAEQERRRLLEESPATFSTRAWPPYGSPDTPKQAPLALQVHGASAWVHEVRLSFGSRERGPRSAAEDMRCQPWNTELPVQLHEGRDLLLDWPAPRMVEPEPISWELDVVWSVQRDGVRASTVVQGGDTEWQRA